VGSLIVVGSARHLARIAVRFILAFLFLTVIGVQFIGVTLANFKPSPYPGTPDTNKPSIKIQEPYPNRTYNAKSITYNVTVERPASWYESPRYGTYLCAVGYIIDGEENVTIAPIVDRSVSRYVLDPTGKFFIRNPELRDVDLPDAQTFTLEGNLSELSEGSHTIQVWTNAVSKYTPADKRNTFLYPVYEIPVYATSGTVSFYVANQEIETEAKPLPTELFTFLLVAAVSVAVAVVVAVAVLAYFKKCKREAEPS
jgi:hypothetical protein